MKKILQQTAFLWPLVIVTLIAFWQVAFMQYTMKWDIMDQFFPMRYFISECFENKVLPIWNPFINLGYPFHGDPQSGFYYPVVWLLALFFGYSVPVVQFEFLLHIIIAGAGMYILLKSFRIHPLIAMLFAISYQLSGLFVSNAQHLTWVISLAWMPWVLYAYFKLLESRNWKFAILCGLFLFLCLTGGYPILSVFLFYILIIFAGLKLITVIRNKETAVIPGYFGLHLLFGFVFILLASGYLYSFFEVMPWIGRGEALSAAMANTIPFSPQCLLSTLLPFAVTGNMDFFNTDTSMANLYMGLLTLPALILYFFVARNRTITTFYIIGAIALLASFGLYLPIRSWLYHLPFMDMFRHASIFRTVTVISFIIVAAYSLDQWFRIFEKKSILKRLLIAMAGFFFLTYTFGFIVYPIRFPDFLNPTEMLAFHATNGVGVHMVVQAIIQLLFLLAMIFIVIRKKILVTNKLIALLIINSINMIVAVQMNAASTIVSDVPVKALHNSLQQMPSGFPVPDDYLISEVTHVGDGSLKPIWFNNSLFYKRIAQDGFNSFSLRSYMNFIASPESEKVLQHPLIFLENADRLSENNINYLSFSPTKIAVEVTANVPNQLILLQNDYKGWSVYIDDIETAHSKYQDSFIQVPVKEGKSKIEFRFELNNKFLQLILPIGSFLIIFIGLLIFGGYRKFRS